MILLAILAVNSAALVIFWGRNSRPGLAISYLLQVAGSAWILAEEVAPVSMIALVALGLPLIAVPLVCFVIAMIDLRFGVFATQTFYAFAVPVFTCPVLTLLAIGLRGSRLLGACL